MKLAFLFAFALLSLVACVPVQDCNIQVRQPCLDLKFCSCEFKDRDAGFSGSVQAPEPTPQPQPEPEPNPPTEPEKEVCDGGARACHDGEAPTGTESDPTKYLGD